jgi:hypothetical protein
VELNITTDSYTSSDDDAVARAGVRAGAEVVRAMYSQRLSPIDKGAGNFVTAVDRGGRSSMSSVSNGLWRSAREAADGAPTLCASGWWILCKTR